MTRKKILAAGLGVVALVGATTLPIIPTQVPAQYAAEELTWNTPSGDLAIGDYGPDETGNFFWIRLVDKYEKVELSFDVSKLIFRDYRGKRWVKYGESDGKFIAQEQTEIEYRTKDNVTNTQIDTFRPLIKTPIADAAIAYDTSQKGTCGPCTSLTITFAPTATASFVTGLWSAEGNTTISSATWNGTSMTIILNNNNANESTAAVGITSPSTGSHDLIFNFASDGVIAFAASYTGSGTTVPTNTGNNYATAGSSISASVTVAQSTGWVIGIGSNDFKNGISMSTGETLRNFNGGSAAGSSRGIFDTASAPGTGSHTSTMSSGSGSGNWSMVIFELDEPSAAVSTVKVPDIIQDSF